MDRNSMTRLDKGIFIFLVIVAGAAVLTAMIAGPLGRERLSIGAAASGGIIAFFLLLQVLTSNGRRK